MEEIKNTLHDLKVRLSKIASQKNPDEIQKEIRELEAQTMKEGFWNDQSEARKITKQLADKQKELATIEELEQRINNALELSGETAMQPDLEKEIKYIEEMLSDLELKLFLSGPHDSSEAILSIHSGAGGIEAMDWVSMLYRMYQRFFETKGWEFEVSDEAPGEEAGFKTVSLLYADRAIAKAVATEIQAMLQENLNIHVELAQQEWKVYLHSMSDLDYDLCTSSWIGDYNDPNTFMDMFVTKGGNNRTGWSNLKYDALIREASEELDTQKRMEIFRKAETMLCRDELPIVPIYFYVGIQFYDPNRITGIYPNVLDEHPLKYIRKIESRKR